MKGGEQVKPYFKLAKGLNLPARAFAKALDVDAKQNAVRSFVVMGDRCRFLEYQAPMIVVVCIR